MPDSTGSAARTVCKPRRDDRRRSVEGVARSGDVLFLLFAIAIASTACAGDDAVPRDAGADGGSPGAAARFDPEGGSPLAFAAVPFPSDLYLDAGGHPQIGRLLFGDDDPRLVALRELLGRRTGFCGTCNTYFGIDGALDPASVPESASPGERGAVGDAILLADVDSGSPERGRIFPLRIEYDPSDGVVAVRPVRGVTLHRGRTYAAVLTSALHAADGSELTASAAFAAVRDERSGGSPAIAHARELIAPALDTLAELGVARDRVVSAAVFTVGDPTEELRRARSLVHAAPLPVATVDRVWQTPAELDALLGVPSEDRPGVDVPPVPGEEGTRSVRHRTVAAIVAGRFEAPRLVDGAGAELGAPRVGSDGQLAAGPQQAVPFILIVPAGADVTSLPVVVHHHGFNASRTTGFVLADTAGAAGAAVLSIDGFLHGDRAAAHRDELLNARDAPGMDGLAETDTLAVSGRVFGIDGAPPGMELYPGYPFGAFLQFVSDAMAAVRLVHEGDVSAIAAAGPALAGLAFDPTRVFYAGNSMGAVVGAGVLATESDVAAYALNVQPGSIVETLVEGPEFRPLSDAVFLPTLGVRGTFDEITRSLVFHPTIDLFRWAMEPVDPLGLAPYLVADRVAPGAAPDVLIQLAGLDEVAATTASQSMVAAASIPAVGELEHVVAAAAALPLSQNVDSASGPITAAAVRFDPAEHGMLEVRDQESRYEPPLAPPFMLRAMPLPIENPIVEVHEQLEHFFRTRIDTGHAEIR